jgi:predicted GIY-YIG superfamily endonuclease
MPTNDELEELYRERILVEKRLSQLNAKIGLLQGKLDEQTIVETMGHVMDDDEKFVKWYTSRKAKIDKKKRKDENKNAIKPSGEFTYIYALIHRGEIVYIGVSGNIHSRMLDHKKDKNKTFDSYRILSSCTDRFYALREENTLIKKHKPKYNKQWF